MNAAKTASRRNLLSCVLTLTKRIANAIAKTIERINNTIERFSLSIQIRIYLSDNFLRFKQYRAMIAQMAKPSRTMTAVLGKEMT